MTLFYLPNFHFNLKFSIISFHTFLTLSCFLCSLSFSSQSVNYFTIYDAKIKDKWENRVGRKYYPDHHWVLLFIFLSSQCKQFIWCIRFNVWFSYAKIYIRYVFIFNLSFSLPSNSFFLNGFGWVVVGLIFRDLKTRLEVRKIVQISLLKLLSIWRCEETQEIVGFELGF